MLRLLVKRVSVPDLKAQHRVLQSGVRLPLCRRYSFNEEARFWYFAAWPVALINVPAWAWPRTISRC